ncbi:MAG TPA: AMP-binding protein [Alphaproteobacteria bacterium]|nr:AMP-binding protein [Alphaproteobacteria bacterium]
MDIANWIERWAAFQPEKFALRFEGSALGYAAFADRIAAVARMLKSELGIGRGDRIAFLGYNSPEFLALLFACARLGAMLVPLNWRLAAPEHRYILSDAAAAALFVEPELVDHAEQLRAALPDCRFVGLGTAKADWLAYDALIGEAGGDGRNPHVGLETPLLIVYTAGTTGRPKGAVLTQSALTWNAVNATAMHDLTSRDAVLTTLPLFHVGGLNIQTLPALHAGAAVILHRRFELELAMRAIAEDRPSLTVLVPAQLKALIEHPGWVRLDLGSLRAVTTGSTIVPLPLIEAWHARGVPIIQVYGSTETAPVAVHQRIEDARATAGSTGKPALHCEARIVTREGREAGPGERGEILVRGPNVMFEYWGDPAATAEALRDGWFHTGDVGHRDERGNFYVDERKKDLIISGSENIYPAEIEAVLQESAAIADAAVVARPHERWGEVPVAVVVPRPGAELTRDAVLALFEGRLARFKHPHDVLFVAELPRNAMGKVLKYRLREIVKG